MPAQIKDKEYYYKRFRQIPLDIVSCQYSRNRWVLRLLDKQLKDPAECGIGFFHFLVAKCLEIGESSLKEVVSAGVPLYQFVQEHERLKRKKALKAL